MLSCTQTSPGCNFPSAWRQASFALVPVPGRCRVAVGDEELDMVDQGAVLAAHALGLERVLNGGGGHRQRTHVRKFEIARRVWSEEEPIAAPGDVAANGAQTRNLDLNRCGETVTTAR